VVGKAEGRPRSPVEAAQGPARFRVVNANRPVGMAERHLPAVGSEGRGVFVRAVGVVQDADRLGAVDPPNAGRDGDRLRVSSRTDGDESPVQAVPGVAAQAADRPEKGANSNGN
jgi:hypothetical protein